MVGDVLAVIMIAVRDVRIAVIGLRFDQVDLVAALRPHFLIPEFSRAVVRQPQAIAVAERPDLRADAAPLRLWGVGERMVGGTAAVGLAANDLEIGKGTVREREV